MGAPERRRFPRVQESFEVQYRVYGDMASSWHEVATLSLSAGGLRFRGPEPLEPGTPLELKVQLAGFQQALVLRGAVVWNRLQSPGVTECGVQFVGLTMPQQAQIDRLVLFLRQRV
jgi:hypothetical protein